MLQLLFLFLFFIVLAVGKIFLISTMITHQENFDTEGSIDEQYYSSYADLSVHQLMLSDVPRMEFYKSALSEKNVKGKIIVDVGAGSGILSFFAAKAGAQHVFCIEGSSLNTLLPEIMKDNGLGDKVSVLPTTVESMIEGGVSEFIKKYAFLNKFNGISVIVSEWMGFYLLHEGMLQSVLAARNFFKEVNEALGITSPIDMIPSSSEMYIAPISLGPFKKKYIDEWKNCGGFNLERLGGLAYEQLLESSPLIDILPKECLVHEGYPFWKADLLCITPDELDSIRAETTFFFDTSENFKAHLHRNGKVAIDGFVLWFTVSHGSLTLNTSPCYPSTHWKQTVTLLPANYREDGIVCFTEPNESLSLSLNLEVCDESKRFYTISTEIN